MNDEGKRNSLSNYPHYIGVRISDRQYNDMESLKRARGVTETYIMREALQDYLNKSMYKLINQDKVK